MIVEESLGAEFFHVVVDHGYGQQATVGQLRLRYVRVLRNLLHDVHLVQPGGGQKKLLRDFGGHLFYSLNGSNRMIVPTLQRQQGIDRRNALNTLGFVVPIAGTVQVNKCRIHSMRLIKADRHTSRCFQSSRLLFHDRFQRSQNTGLQKPCASLPRTRERAVALHGEWQI
jgi:hypothetical protein